MSENGSGGGVYGDGGVVRDPSCSQVAGLEWGHQGEMAAGVSRLGVLIENSCSGMVVVVAGAGNLVGCTVVIRRFVDFVLVEMGRAPIIVH